MELRQIRYFLALFEEGNVTRAARKLNIVQPALSMQIRRLEEEFGSAFFERTPQGVVPTSAGKRAYQLFLPVMKEIENARQQILDLNGAVSGRIGVGLIPSVAASVLSAAVAEFSAAYPDVEIHIDEAYSGTLLEWVLAGQIDCAVINQLSARTPGIVSDDLVDEELVLVSSRGAGHALPPTVRFADLPGMSLVLPSKRHGLRMIIDRLASEQGIEIQPRIEIDALIPTLELVGCSGRATILPAIALAAGSTALDLRISRIVGPRPSRKLVRIHHVQRPLTLAAERFLDVLRDHIGRAVGTVVRDGHNPD
ncbi:MAG TPA: LysR family transcriptional regulator [Azospirillum sp.]|nr:LysR family transcriptional regulator [Azospirillum sp.]